MMMDNFLRKVYYRLALFVFYKFRAASKWFYKEKLRRESFIVGNGVRINGKAEIVYPRGLTLGNNVHLGKELYVDARAGVSIGDHTHISRRVTIYSTNHNYEGQLIPYDDTLAGKPVVIKEGVWIGMNVSITSGVTIGEGAIIGMGAIISKNVQPYEIVVSGGQRVVGKRDANSFKEKIAQNQFGGVSGKPLHSDLYKDFKLNPISQVESGLGIVFILSTGRAGSNALAKILEDVPGVSAYHEPIYVFLKTISAQYLCGKIDKETAKKQILEIYNGLSLIKKGTIYVESDQKSVAILDILQEIFPSAKYIWLIRDPYAFALSASSRGWFSDGDKIKFDSKGTALINPKFHSEGLRNFLTYDSDILGENFDKLSVFDRNVFYWKVWNGKIFEFFKGLSEEKKLFVQLEELDLSLHEIRRFLGLGEDISLTNIQTNEVRRGHKTKYEKTKAKLNSYIDQCKVDISSELENWFPKK